MSPVKVYAWCSWGAGTTDQVWTAMAEDGHVIAEHCCPDEASARRGIHDRKRRDYLARFGPGATEGEHYELVWEAPPPEVLEASRARGGDDG